MSHYGIELSERQVLVFGEGDVMNPKDSIIDHFPSLASYYFGHINVHKDRIAAVLVEEYSLAPVILESTATMAMYIRPIIGEVAIVPDSMCYYVIDADWLAIGFSVVATDDSECQIVYLTRTGTTMTIPMAITPGDKVTAVYSVH
jgi:hypothetical protein